MAAFVTILILGVFLPFIVGSTVDGRVGHGGLGWALGAAAGLGTVGAYVIVGFVYYIFDKADQLCTRTGC